MPEEKVVSTSELRDEIEKKLKPVIEQIAKEIFGVKLGGFYVLYHMALFDMPDDEVDINFRIPLCTVRYVEVPENMSVEDLVDMKCWKPDTEVKVIFDDIVVTVEENYGYGKKRAGVVLFAEVRTYVSKLDKVPDVTRKVLTLIKSLKTHT